MSTDRLDLEKIFNKYQSSIPLPIPQELHIALSKTKGEFLGKFFPIFQSDLTIFSHNFKPLLSEGTNKISISKFHAFYKLFVNASCNAIEKSLENYLKTDNSFEKKFILFYDSKIMEVDNHILLKDNLMASGSLLIEFLQFLKIKYSKSEFTLYKEEIQTFLNQQREYLKRQARELSTHQNARLNASAMFKFEDDVIKKLQNLQIDINTHKQDLTIGCPAVFTKVESCYGNNLFDAGINLMNEILIENIFGAYNEIELIPQTSKMRAFLSNITFGFIKSF